MAKFRNVEFEMVRGNGYGQYYILATYKNKNIKVHTTDSETWDWLHDESNKKNYDEARRFCYNRIVEEYEYQQSLL